MIAYKFRGASALDRTMDILLNDQLYCADWRNLNDPMEGIFEYWTKGHAHRRHELDAIRQHKLQYRVCSLSKTWDSALLWAHYAESFTGLAIEVEVPNPIDIRDEAYDPYNLLAQPLVTEIEYRPDWAFARTDGRPGALTLAQRILSSKHQDWRYEAEVRVLSPHEYYPIGGGIRRVILGPRASKALTDAVRMVSLQKGIEVCQLEIGTQGLAIRPTRRGRRALEPN